MLSVIVSTSDKYELLISLRAHPKHLLSTIMNVSLQYKQLQNLIMTIIMLQNDTQNSIQNTLERSTEYVTEIPMRFLHSKVN
jgi:hypothetical protein